MIKRKHHPAQADCYDVCYTPAIIPLALQVFGMIQGGNAGQDEANLQAQIDRDRAAGEKAAAGVDAATFEREQSAKRARARAQRSGSGVIVGVGTDLLVQEDISAEIARGKALIKAGGDINAARLNQSASLLEFSGANKRRAGLIGAGTTALTGGARIFNNLA